MTHLLGIDIGTSGAKAVIVSETGIVEAAVTRTYPLSTPKPLWAEQNPADWWNAVIAGIRGVLAKATITGEDIAGVGLTGQMHGLVMLDQSGGVLRPCIMWNDQRTAAQCESLTARVGARRVLELTGNPILPGFTAPKIAWVRENEPDVFARVSKCLLPKDYIRYKLSGEFFSDVSDASGTALFDAGSRRWSPEMLDALEIPSNWMPEVTESPVASSAVSPDAAALTGLKPGTPIVGGGGDQAAQAVGMGIISEGIVSATLGTSGVVFASSDTYRVEPEGRLHAFCHAVPGKWHLMGVMLSAAGSFRWYRDALCADEISRQAKTGTDAYDMLTDAAATVPAGSEGLFFLPYLTGERTPYPDPNARGAFIGLTLRHGKNHMTRAVLEGITYGMNDSLTLMKELGVTIDHIRASGGGAKSAFWRRMLADVFGARIVTVSGSEGAAFGAAVLAAVGAGVHTDVETACREMVRLDSETEPGEDASRYAEFYPLYRALYPALKDNFTAITDTVMAYFDG